MSKAYPWYLALNDRPFKVVRTSDGGLDVLALDVNTGEFERDMNMLSAYLEGGRDVDELTKDEFDALVEKHRAWLRGQ